MSTQEPIPQEWVFLKNPSSNVDDSETAKAFCSFIEKFYWRSRDEKPDEFHMVISGNRYKYLGVPRDVYEEAWKRANNPSEYDRKFGSWYTDEVKESYEYERN